jgi:hypothetical protein
MSMTKRKPVQVIEYRISLQDKQSEQLDSLIAAVQFKQVTSGLGSFLQGLGVPEITKTLKDPTEMLQIFYSIAMILEIFGYETGLPTPADYPQWKLEYEAARAQRAAEGEAGPVKGDFSLGAIIYNLLNPNWDWSAPWFEFTESQK